MGGKPSTQNRYKIGGAGRPEGWGTETGTDAAASVWVQEGPKGDRVRQVTASEQAAPSGRRAGRSRERAVRIPRRGRKSEA